MSADLLVKQGFVEGPYVSNMLGLIEKQGFYTISGDSFTLLHGKGTEGIGKTSLNLLVTREPVVFGEKKVRVIFCLANRDGKEHIPAVVTLMRVVKTAALVHDLEKNRSEEELYQTVLNCEFEVL